MPLVSRRWFRRRARAGARGGREISDIVLRCSGQDRQKLEDARKKLGSCAKALRVGGLIAPPQKNYSPAQPSAQARMAKEQVEVWKKAAGPAPEREILSRNLFDFFEAEAEFSVQKMIWQSLSHDPRPKVSHAPRAASCDGFV